MPAADPHQNQKVVCAMFDKLEVFEQKYEELNARLYDPDVVSDQETYKALMKEHKNLTPIVEAYRS